MKSLNRKSLVITIVLTALASALASTARAEVGVGVSFKTDDASVYIPWQINSNWRLEGELRQLSQDGTNPVVISNSVIPISGTNDADLWEIGAGLFWTQPLDNNVKLLTGLRLNYINSESSSRVNTGTTIVRTTRDIDGFEWAPTLALEYAVSDNIGIAAEVNYFVQNVDQKFRAPGTQTSIESDASGTNTRLILRYFF